MLVSTDGKRKISDHVTIKVRLLDGRAVNGRIAYYVSYYGIVVVSVKRLPVHDGVHLILDQGTEVESSS